MSQYLILIFGDEAEYAAADEQTTKEIHAGHGEFADIAGAAMVGGNALYPTATATSIRKGADGEFTVTDGPFAEIKEALGGYYLVEAEDLDAAIALAKAVPAPWGGVEVRPIQVIDMS
ncbi:hypothetical protein SAMN05892883_0455 [Jatrophihabitans sp. GAS493]|uniref:YciI family protein n=1 Tax=Jatrophihabitans sp. GAS493 TaxID=1907575 RepID=UPI000BB676A5|nr:YciI family protein [Jatrophihabitans sp. GAS493]SOD70814.1 hypothetical protein SAMN05892883_0455 [Jatrophihabitans sp. GAS493]